MPGFIKVNSEQRAVAAPFVKVAGDWKPVALGYIKVNGDWKIWHTAEIEDDFNRPDGSLGTASNGFSAWENLRGSWSILNNEAYSATAATEYPLADVILYKATSDLTVEADIPNESGLGVAAWVVDEDNWWAAASRREEKFYPSFYDCPNGGELNGTRCNKYTSYAATYVPPSSGSYLTCPSGGTLWATNSVCVTTGTTGTVCTSGRFEYPSSIGNLPQEEQDFLVETGFVNEVFVCESYGCRIGTYGCTYSSSFPFDRTCTGGNFCGYIDYYSATRVSFSNPACYSCPQGGSNGNCGTVCTRDDSYDARFNPARTEYEPRLTIYQMSNGLISIRKNKELTFEPRSIRLETAGTTITGRAYSAVNQSGTVSSTSFTAPLSVPRTTVIGMVKVPSDGSGNQGTSLDNFFAE